MKKGLQCKNIHPYPLVNFGFDANSDEDDDQPQMSLPVRKNDTFKKKPQTNLDDDIQSDGFKCEEDKSSPQYHDTVKLRRKDLNLDIHGSDGSKTGSG